MNNEGNSALMLPAERGMPVLIPALVKGGADVNARSRDGSGSASPRRKVRPPW